MTILVVGGEAGYEFIKRHRILFHSHSLHLAETLVKWTGVLQKKDVLEDTINASICIISRGNPEKLDYAEYLRGIKAIGSHILTMKYSGEIASHQACKVLYLAACLLSGAVFKRIADPKDYIEQSISNNKYRRLASIKKQKLESYGYLVEAVKHWMVNRFPVISCNQSHPLQRGLFV